MRMHKFAAMTVLCGVFAGCFSPGTNTAEAVPDEPVIVPVTEPEQGEDEALRKSYEELKAENRALKRENRKLRRALIRQREGEPVVDLSKVHERRGVIGEEKNGVATNDGGYWLTDGTLRRHNSRCRYYKLGRGRSCTKEEGEPCKRCGG